MDKVTLNVAIKIFEGRAEKDKKDWQYGDAAFHQQIADWLKELKHLREVESCDGK